MKLFHGLLKIWLVFIYGKTHGGISTNQAVSLPLLRQTLGDIFYETVTLTIQNTKKFNNSFIIHKKMGLR